jgi:hypothetical protein
MPIGSLKDDADYLALPQVERAKVVEHLVSKDADFVALPEGEKIKVLNHLVQLPTNVAQEQPAQEPVKQGMFDNLSIKNIPQNLGNLAAGAVRGAGSIGSTLLAASELTPMGVAHNLINHQSLNPMQRDAERRQKMTEGLQDMGADTNSGLFSTGKIGTEIAGTAGAGDILAPIAEAANLPRVANAISSAGFNVGSAKAVAAKDIIKEFLLRATGGAVSGAAQAGLVDPRQAKAGAVIGGALPIGVKAAAMVGHGINNTVSALASNLLGITTGSGANSVKEAYRAGKNGSTSFLDNMRGDVSMDDVIAQAKQGLSNMRADRAAEYKNGMAAISNDKSVLDFQPILNSVNKIQSLGNYKGQVINQNSSNTVDEIANKVSEWSKLNPNEFHTPEGLDALKQSIGDIRDSTQFGTQARKAADTAYNAVKDQIVKQAPTYSKTMASYSEASKTLSEIEKALSLGNKASADTSIRKLQSLMRNNVSTNYGNRLSLANTLADKGGADILPSVAGQAMNSWTPRGLIGAGESGAGIMSAVLNPATIPHVLAAAPFASPRLVGESAYKLGQLTGGAGKAISSPQEIETIRKLIATNPNLYSSLLKEMQSATTSQ